MTFIPTNNPSPYPLRPKMRYVIIELETWMELASGKTNEHDTIESLIDLANDYFGQDSKPLMLLVEFIGVIATHK